MTKRKIVSIVVFVIFLCIGLVLFSNVVSAQFVSDDWHWLWAAHERGTIVPNFFTNYAGDTSGGSYNPMSSFWINSLYQLAGLRPWVFHVGSIVLHVVNACLVVLVCSRLLSVFSDASTRTHPMRRYAIFGSGLLFLIWPTHVEAIAWVASVPHLLATFFSLLALTMYLGWLRKHEAFYGALSLFFSIGALFSKEVAVCLPVIIFIMHVVFDRQRHHKPSMHSYMWWFGIVAAMIGFIIVRHSATGLWIGSYVDQSIVFRPYQWINTFLTFFVELMTLGLGRHAWMAWFWHHEYIASILGLIVVGSISIVIMRRKDTLIHLLYMLFLISIVPFIPFGFHRMTMEGERYTYLPSVFFIMLVSVVFMHIRSIRRVYGIVGLIALVSCMLIIQKSSLWTDAGFVEQGIIDQSAELMRLSAPGVRFMFVALPDSLSGAQVSRNNLREAIALTHADILHETTIVPAYLQIGAEQITGSLVSWKSFDRGIHGQSANGAHVVTGIDREVMPWGTYELWHYDYSQFTSDTIHLIFTAQTQNDLMSGRIQLLTWDNGAVKRLDPNAL